MKKYEIDLCHGPLVPKILQFALPLMATYILQLLFNAVDLVVIGQYAHYNAMAAIGATMNFNSLVINVFIGLAIGANCVISRFYGAKDFVNLKKAVQTCMTVSWIGGIILMIIALAIAKRVLIFMGTPEDILPLSCTYIWICFAAIPFIMLYNFGCSVLRAVGDTKRPMYYLIFAGIVNVLLNLFLVKVFKMDVAGVAIATFVSHLISAVLVIRTLLKTNDCYKFDWKDFCIDTKILKSMLQFGIPASIQSASFAVSNMIIQSSINSFGPAAIAGITAALGLEGIIYVANFAFHQTAITFISQNMGGQKYKRMLKVIYLSYVFSVITCLILGWGCFFLGRQLLGIFNPNPEVIELGFIRIKVVFTTFFLVSFLDTGGGILRGLGYSMYSTINSIMGACVFRILWVWFVFSHVRTMEVLLLSYPISWALVGIINGISIAILYRKIVREKCSRITHFSKHGFYLPRGLRFLGGAK
jgi:putative MATE family efflux protein